MVTTRLPRPAASNAASLTRFMRSAAGKTWSPARDRLPLDVRRERNLADMHLEDALAADDVRVRHHDLAVEAAPAPKRRIEHIETVCRRDQDDAHIGLETIHLDEELIQGLFALVISSTEPGTTTPPDGVDFIDEDDAGRTLLGLRKHVADAAGTDSDEHFHEIRSGNREERHIGFARNSPGEQSFAGPRWADQQNPQRGPLAKPVERLQRDLG